MQKLFTWDPMHEDRIRKNFENRGNACLRDLAKKGTTTRSLSGSVMRYGKDSKSIEQMNHTKNYVEEPRKIGLVIPRVLDHLFIPTAQSLCTSIGGVWYQTVNLTTLFDLFVSLWYLTCFPEFV